MKKLLYVIIGIGVLYLILAMFGPSKVVVQRNVTINKPADVIKKHLVDWKFFHDTWSPWTPKDPTMTVVYAGNAGEIGHKMDWSGNDKVRTGTMELEAINGDTIISKLTFGNSGDNKAYYYVTGKENAADVTWKLEMHIPFYGRPMMLFMNMDKMMGPDFENGLANLKKVMEEMKEETSTANYDIKEIEWPESNFVGSKKETVQFMKMGDFFGKHFPAIAKELGTAKVQPEGPPVGIYWAYDMANMSTDVAAAFKVAKGIKVKGYESYSFPESKVLQLAYYGDYQKMQGAYEALDAFTKQKGANKVCTIEEYVTDPMSEKDTAKWLTNIYYILK